MSSIVTVADCERVQASWYRTRTEILGGSLWDDGPLTWMSGADGMHLMFPSELPRAALARGVERARDLGVDIGVWLNSAVDAFSLANAGFERGWSPWWMTAPIADIGPAGDPRIELQDDSADYTGEHADYRAELALARARPRHSWYAAAYTRPAGRFAGRAWSHRSGNLAGVFDMAVWPPFRRRGLGTGLLRAVCAAAGAAGATHAVLNATPEGRLLYQRHGFVHIGEGITWWLHPEP
ncbi:N-acetyltransferase [Streptomyces sp. HPF1205]|uniref:GNAT family N-acetyltransferase n=1 Tax=Streptomyces sp. HPF1205 TaxID=2873262 RepID=UPI001CEDDE64|nr:GNAT family N-acetyltransferase [Streptomyces sp. HPF1205]